MQALDLFSYIPPAPQSILGDRNGETYSRAKDLKRLNRQAQAVWDFMASGKWCSLREISDATGAPEASVSARIRDFRKTEFGGHTVHNRRISKGSWQYRLEPKV